MSRNAEPEFQAYCGVELKEKDLNPAVIAPLGAQVVKGSAWLDCNKFLDAVCDYLKTENSFVQDTIDHSELIISDKIVIWKNYAADNIINCTGHAASSDPFFHHLKWNLSKGELIVIHAPDLKLHNIIHKGIKIIPLENENYLCGATDTRSFENSNVTDEAREHLVKLVTKAVRCEFEIIKHMAGIRPATIDRRPFLGFHPEYSRAGILNGFGSKGVLLAPYFSMLMTKMIHGEKLPEEAIDFVTV